MLPEEQGKGGAKDHSAQSVTNTHPSLLILTFPASDCGTLQISSSINVLPWPPDLSSLAVRVLSLEHRRQEEDGAILQPHVGQSSR
jgi:hypothetical protein